MSAPSPEDLIADAKVVAESAYAPYSNFRVGAVAVAADGSRHRGANVENAAYGSTVCAEASAIAAAATAGVRDIETVAVACLDGDDCYPCGNCRQMMREFRVQTVVVEDEAGNPRVHRFDDLLPHSFGPESLG